MKVYIAGPMTGIPQFNIPMFKNVAVELRAQGYDVVSPAELDSPEMQAAALESKDGGLADLEAKTKETWGEVLARDVRVLSDHGIEAIALLPGWKNSRGARLEATVGLLNKLAFFVFHDGLLWSVPREWVLKGINEGFAAMWGAK